MLRNGCLLNVSLNLGLFYSIYEANEVLSFVLP